MGATARMVVSNLIGKGRADVVVLDAQELTWWQRKAALAPVEVSLAQPGTAVAIGELDGAFPREVVIGHRSALSVMAVDDAGLRPRGEVAVDGDVQDVAVLEVQGGEGRIAWTPGDESGRIDIVDGAGTLVGSISVGSQPRFASTFDYDGDAWLDLAVTAGPPARLSVLRGDPSGLIAGPSVALPAAPAAIAPYDRDGRAGFAVVFGDGGLALVAASRAGELFVQQPLDEPLGLAEPRVITAVDANVDGSLDLLVGGPRELRLLPSEAGAFGFDVAFADRGASALAAARDGVLPTADLFVFDDGKFVRLQGER